MLEGYLGQCFRVLLVSVPVFQDLSDAGHLQRGADQGDGRVSLISFTDSGRRFAETVKDTFEELVKESFVDPLDDADIAAIIRIGRSSRAPKAD